MPKYGKSIREWLKDQPNHTARVRLVGVRDIPETDGDDPKDDLVIAVMEENSPVRHKDLVEAVNPAHKKQLMENRAKPDSERQMITVRLNPDDLDGDPQVVQDTTGTDASKVGE